VFPSLAHRTVSGAPGAVHSKLFSFGFSMRSSAIIHRTKPLMVDQLQALTISLRGGAPDTVRWRTGHCPVAHWTLSGGAPDCPVRPSLAAFSNGYNLVGGYKYHPIPATSRCGSPSNIPSNIVDISKPSQPSPFIYLSHTQDLGHHKQYKCHKREIKQKRATHVSLALVPCEIH
jgi:hypothetical protein